jgi:hypothetical protein
MRDNSDSSLRKLLFGVGITALIISALNACVRRQQKQVGSTRSSAIVQGVLTKDDQPIAGARVVLNRKMDKPWEYDVKNAKTGSDGQFVFENLGPGSYYFNIEFETRGAAPCTINNPGYNSGQVNASSHHPLINASNYNSPFPVHSGDDLKLTIEFTCPYKALDQHIEQHLNEYISLSKLESRNETPYVSDKVLIVDERGISSQHFPLPEEIRATDPKAVGTVVFVNCELDTVGYYSGGTTPGAPVNETVCEIALIDLTRRVIVHKRRFRESGSGAWPKGNDISSFISGLPRR